MKKMLLYTFVSGCLSLMLSSCGTYFSVGGGYGGPVAVYDDGYNVGYSSTYGRLGYEEARREALFLSDKMAYELGTTTVMLIGFIIVMLTAATITVHVRQIITPIVEGAIGIQKAIMQDVLEPVGIHLL